MCERFEGAAIVEIGYPTNKARTEITRSARDLQSAIARIAAHALL